MYRKILVMILSLCFANFLTPGIIIHAEKLYSEEAYYGLFMKGDIFLEVYLHTDYDPNERGVAYLISKPTQKYDYGYPEYERIGEIGRIYGENGNYFIRGNGVDLQLYYEKKGIVLKDNSEGSSIYSGEYVQISNVGPFMDEQEIWLAFPPTEIKTIIGSNGNQYTLYESSMRWDNAADWCKVYNGHLVTITTEEELNMVKDLVSEHGGAFWTGAIFDSEGRFEMMWITGEYMNKDFFVDELYDPAMGARYIDMYDSENGKLLYSNDFPFGSCRYFICETEVYNRNLKNGDIIGTLYATDIFAKVNGYIVESYNLNGKTAILLEDLAQYGAVVIYDDRTRYLVVNTDSMNNMHNLNISNRKAEAKNIYYSDIKVYLNGYLIKTFSLNGKMAAAIEDIGNNDEFSKYKAKYSWNEFSRIISLDFIVDN